MKTVSISEEEFIDFAARAMSEFIYRNPEAILIAEDLATISAIMVKNIFDDRKGGKIYEFRNRND